MGKVYENGVCIGEFTPSDELEQERQKLLKDMNRYCQEKNITMKQLGNQIDKLSREQNGVRIIKAK